MLASVTCLDEAELVIAGGADIIDCKDPARGALGALSIAVVAAMRARLANAIISATIGDLPARADAVVPAALRMATTGVDFVKVGLFPGGDAGEAIRGLGQAFGGLAVAGGARLPAGLVGVLLADRDPDLSLIARMAEAGFGAVLIDTAGKDGRSLTDIVGRGQLSAFLREAHSHGLAAGLAGSLKAEQARELSDLGADILGFRGALCRGSDRRGTVDVVHVSRVRAAIDGAATAADRLPGGAGQEELHP